MKLIQHPEYSHVYISNREIALHCQEAVARWKATNDVIAVPDYALQWTVESAQMFVHSLSQLFQAYNQVLWNTFHYCRQCGGQCCVVDASNIQPFDLLAIALLGLQAPVLPESITARERECIYLLNHRCSWPQEWRTIKCWSFYCLGVGPRTPDDSVGKLYTAITSELQQVVREHLPNQLRQYEQVHNVSLTDYLDDPVCFSEKLHDALIEIFVNPLSKIYPVIDIQKPHNNKKLNGTAHNADDDVLTSISEIAEQVCESPLTILQEFGLSPEQVLADLESLQWIIEGHPANEQQILKDIYARYASTPTFNMGDRSTIRYCMCKIVNTVLATVPKRSIH